MKLHSIIHVILFCVFMNVLGSAQTALTLQLSSEKPSYLAGEPVVVCLSIFNISGTPVKLPKDVGPELDMVHYFITPPRGEKALFGPLFVADVGEKHYTELMKNQSIHGCARIFYGTKGYTFAKPGRYAVVAECKGFTSNSLTITIESPADSKAKEVAALVLDHPEVGLFLVLEGGDELADAQAQMNTILEKYADSPIADYIRFAKGKSLAVPARNFVSKTPRKADLEKAMPLLEKAKASEKMQLFYRSKASQTISRNLVKTNQKAQAQEELNSFRKTIGNSIKMKKFLDPELVQELERIQ